MNIDIDKNIQGKEKDNRIMKAPFHMCGFT